MDDIQIEDTPLEETPQEETQQEDTPQEETPEEEAPKAEAPKVETPQAPAHETKWYVLRVVSGKERKVKEYLDIEVTRGGWNEIVKQVFLPVEKVYKVQNGKKVMRERNYY